MVGRHSDFEIALQKLRGPQANITREAGEIQVQSKTRKSVLLRDMTFFVFWIPVYRST